MIQNDSDVRQWAEMIVKANGEKFTPLTKGEQFLIAKYILKSEENVSTEVSDTSPDKTTEQTKEHDAHTQEQKKNDLKHPPIMKMTRGVAFHFSGFTAQQAFDKFLEETKGKNDMSRVMDFSTGRQSVDAAFAYWLNEILNVNIKD